MACVFLAAAFMLGGGTRIELVGPILLRVIAIAILGWLVVRRDVNWSELQPRERLFFVVLFALPLIQLIPLPPAIWHHFTGRDIAIEADRLLGEAHWRPMSLTPERTLNAMLALLIPLAAFAVARALDKRAVKAVMATMVGIGTISAGLGLCQIILGGDSALYFYEVTNSDASVGLFSNANHHGLFLACVIPCLLFLTQEKLKSGGARVIEIMIFSTCLTAVLAISTILTFSRAGIGLFIAAFIISFWSFDTKYLGISRARFITVGACLLFGAVLVSGLLALSGLLGTDLLTNMVEDGRISNVAVFASIAKSFFPWGSGLGSFQPVFMTFETVETMDLTYLNQAHNEPAQILIESGLAGLALMVAFLMWWSHATISAWRNAHSDRRAKLTFQRVATLIIGLCLVHSLFDYPLRGGAMASIFGFFVGCLTNVALLRSTAPSRGRGQSVELD